MVARSCLYSCKASFPFAFRAAFKVGVGQFKYLIKAGIIGAIFLFKVGYCVFCSHFSSINYTAKLFIFN